MQTTNAQTSMRIPAVYSVPLLFPIWKLATCPKYILVSSYHFINAKIFELTLLYSGNPYWDALTNNEDPDEMPHDAAFHQNQHCLLRLNQSSEKEIQFYLDIINLWLLNIYNEPSKVYCLISGGRTHQST